jgi:hypothetical protein
MVIRHDKYNIGPSLFRLILSKKKSWQGEQQQAKDIKIFHVHIQRLLI